MILIAIIFLLLIGTFIIGLIILLIRLFKKDQKNFTIKTGLIIISIPLTILVTYFLYIFTHDIFTKKPNEKDLVGIYHISEAGGQISKNLYNSYTLEFKNDRTFYLSSTPNIDVCENGKYSVDWQFDNNEISFQCGAGITTAHIDRDFSEFRIEFSLVDRNKGKSIFFSKDK